MAADVEGALKCRLRLEATWTANALEGTIDDQLFAIKSLEEDYDDELVARVLGGTRSQIHFIYIPAIRDATTHLASLLKGRLWRAIEWSANMSTELDASGSKLNAAFEGEQGVSRLLDSLTSRWQQVQGAGTHSQPIIRPINSKLNEFVSNVGVVFRPDETGRDREVAELSDGQRSMFCISLVSSTIDVENRIRESFDGFNQEVISLPVLTIVGLEEPENNLMPFYLSRIISQIQEITEDKKIQAVISSHSASVLSRVEPTQIRHFRSAAPGLNAIREIALPEDDEAHKYIREAVRAYPELYFASFVVLGEGSSEEIVIPKIAESLDLPIDRSFVAVVPLGGRHVNHLWKLLVDLDIPYVTLLDLDLGRSGGGVGRVQYVLRQLEEIGVKRELLFDQAFPQDILETSSISTALLYEWCDRLRRHGVYFSSPLDIDMSMLTAFPDSYKATSGDGGRPGTGGDALKAVLGEKGDSSAISETLPYDWYRYLFLGRGKPTTHAKALSVVELAEIRSSAPEELRALVTHVSGFLTAKADGGPDGE